MKPRPKTGTLTTKSKRSQESVLNTRGHQNPSPDPTDRMYDTVEMPAWKRKSLGFFRSNKALPIAFQTGRECCADKASGRSLCILGEASNIWKGELTCDLEPLFTCFFPLLPSWRLYSKQRKCTHFCGHLHCHQLTVIKFTPNAPLWLRVDSGS